MRMWSKQHLKIRYIYTPSPTGRGKARPWEASHPLWRCTVAWPRNSSPRREEGPAGGEGAFPASTTSLTGALTKLRRNRRAAVGIWGQGPLTRSYRTTLSPTGRGKATPCQGPLTQRCALTSPPKGEVFRGKSVPQGPLSLGGEGRQGVRGPSSLCNIADQRSHGATAKQGSNLACGQGPLTRPYRTTLSPTGRGKATPCEQSHPLWGQTVAWP